MKAASISKAALIMASMGILVDSTLAAAVTTPAQPKKTFTKTTVAFAPATFKVSYGQTIKLCATVTPARMTSKVVFDSSPADVLTITQATDEAGCAGISLTVKSNVAVCQNQATIRAKVAGKAVKTSAGTIILPVSERAVLIGSGSNLDPGCGTPGIGCFFKEYAVLFSGPPGETLSLAGLKVAEVLSPKMQVGTTPNCPFGGPQPSVVEAALSPSFQQWGVLDHLEIPAGSVPGACADRYLQTVLVEACQVQTNVLTMSADNFGSRSITRSDE